ncbi:MAG TPA: carotenoid oxygenase family protein [Myxococcota bacterium]|nr:carotenoid oxygenase family protein [Myxococcota bacterium]
MILVLMLACSGGSGKDDSSNAPPINQDDSAEKVCEGSYPKVTELTIEDAGSLTVDAGTFNSFAVSAQAEDDGYLVMPVWNPVDARSEIQIFDCRGARLAEGPVARILVPRRIPHGFHATYVSQKTLQRWQ